MDTKHGSHLGTSVEIRGALGNPEYVPVDCFVGTARLQVPVLGTNLDAEVRRCVSWPGPQPYYVLRSKCSIVISGGTRQLGRAQITPTMIPVAPQASRTNDIVLDARRVRPKPVTGEGQSTRQTRSLQSWVVHAALHTMELCRACPLVRESLGRSAGLSKAIIGICHWRMSNGDTNRAHVGRSALSGSS